MVAANSIPGTPEHWKELPLESAALLIEFGADDADGHGRRSEPRPPMRCSPTPRAVPSRRLHDAISETIELFWRVREGLHGLIGKLRPPEHGTDRRGRLRASGADRRRGRATCAQLLTEHGFLGGVAGHASAGNLHFMLTPGLRQVPADVDRYESFMEKLVALIVDTYDGSLKAEHGTGVNMAPFVEREWGETSRPS